VKTYFEYEPGMGFEVKSERDVMNIKEKGEEEEIDEEE